MKYKQSIALFAVFLVFPALSWSAPNISGFSGTASNGETFVIQGSSFSTKASSTPLVWDNLEDGAANTTATVGTWTIVEGCAAIESTTKHAGTYAIRLPSTSGDTWRCNLVKEWPSPANGMKFYASRWTRYNQTLDGNDKFFRMYPDDTYPNIVFSWHAEGTIATESHEEKNFSGLSRPQANTWYFEEWLIQLSSAAGSSNATIRYFKDGVEAGGDLPWYNALTRPTGQALITQLWWGLNDGDAAWEDPSFIAYQDNLYFDTSWSRVVICNNNTYSSRGQCEVQPMTAWADGEITVTLNMGAWASGTKYLYVIDGNNSNNSTGEAIVIGQTYGESDTTAPELTVPSPSTTQACTSDPRNVTISITATDDTDVTACKYDTSNVDIDSMSGTLTEGGSDVWSDTVSNACGATYTYYVKCEDAADNESDAETISYSVRAQAVGAGCTISGSGGSIQ